MFRFPQPLVLSGLACALLVAGCLVAWAAVTDSSEAQTGSMQDCPSAGMWSISVWDGASGTATADALATCGVDSVAAAYSLDAQTGVWSRWFAANPSVSDLTSLEDMQGVLALGSATGPAATPTPMSTATPAPQWPTPSAGCSAWQSLLMDCTSTLDECTDAVTTCSAASSACQSALAEACDLAELAISYYNLYGSGISPLLDAAFSDIEDWWHDTCP
jgi:hypothetical protein